MKLWPDRWRRSRSLARREWMRLMPPIDQSPIGDGTVFSGLEAGPSAQALLRETQGIFDAARRAIADRMSSLTWELVAGEGDDEEKVEEHQALEVLRGRAAGPGLRPLHDSRQQLWLMSSHITSVGESYLQRVGDQGNGDVTRMLYLLKPENVLPIVSGGLVSGYRVQQGNGQIFDDVPAGDIIRAWYPDIQDLFSAQGTLEANAVEYDASKFANEQTRYFYKHNAIPPVVLESSDNTDVVQLQSAADDGDLERFQAIWQRNYNNRSGRLPGAPVMLPWGMAAKVIEQANKSEQVPLLEFYRDHLLMATRTPASVLGRVVSGDRSAAETQQFVFDLQTVTPQAELIACALNEQWVRPEYGDQFTLRFHEFVSRDKVFELSKERQDLELKVRSIDMVREDRGDDAVDWGEEPVGTVADVPYRPDEAFEMPEDDPGALGDEPPPVIEDEETVDDEPRQRAASAEVRAAWRRARQIERRYVPTMARQMVGIFNRQEEALNRELLRVAQRSVSGNRIGVEQVDMVRAVGDYASAVGHEVEYDRIAEMFMDQCRALDVESIIATVIRVLRPARWRAIFQDLPDATRRTATAAAADSTLDALPGENAFELTANMIAQFRRQGERFLEQVQTTTIRRLAPALVEEFSESVGMGESVDQLAKRIESTVGKEFLTRKNQARTIARTEIATAQGSGNLAGAEQSGVVQTKTWNTSLDEKVRDSHQIEGQTTLLNGTFTLNSGAQARFESDPLLPAEDRINCRCFVTFNTVASPPPVGTPFQPPGGLP